MALDKLNTDLTELVDLIEGGGLDQFDVAEKTALWQRFEAFRNRLPLIDHRMIADAEATDLAGSYGFTNMGRFLTRILQLSAGEAASRVRAAATVGPRSSMLGERLEPILPRLAALQREGTVSAEKVQIVERAMHQLSRTGLEPAAVQTAEQLLTDYAPLLGPAICGAMRCRLWMRLILMDRNRSMSTSNKIAATWNSNSGGMACGGCRANSPPLRVPNSAQSWIR